MTPSLFYVLSIEGGLQIFQDDDLFKRLKLEENYYDNKLKKHE